MSESDLPRKKGRLPPLSLENPGESSTDDPPRRRKKKPAPSQDSADEEGVRKTPSRPRARSNSRARSGTEGEVGDADKPASQRDSTRRPRKPKTVTVAGTGGEESETGEHSTEQRPRPKRKPKAPRTESKEELVGNGHTIDGETTRSAQPARKKRKRKPRVQEGHDGPMELGLEAELRELEEDVVAADNSDDSVDDNKWAIPPMRSEPINKLFIEQRSGFKTTNKAKIARKRADQQRRAMEVPGPSRTKNTIQFAISSHRGFKTIALFFQGLLAGICLWQIVTVYMLSNQGYDVLLAQYYKLALPVQSMYYFLFAVSTVAVFDRNDIARPTRQFVLRSVTMQSSAIACFFYFFGLVCSLAIARTDDKIGLSVKQPDLWEDVEARNSELKTWVIMNLVRGLMPILGWFVMSLRPTSDRLIKNLEKADENIIGDQEASAVNMEGDLAAGV